MKKILAMILAVALLCTMTCAWAEDEEEYAWSMPGEKHITELLAPVKEIRNEEEAWAYAEELWSLLSDKPLPDGESDLLVDRHDNSYHYDICDMDGRELYTVSFLSTGVIQQIGYDDEDERRYTDSVRLETGDLEAELLESAQEQVEARVEQIAPGILGLVEPLVVDQIIDVGDKKYMYFYAMPLDPDYDSCVYVIAVLYEDGSCELMDFSCYGAG